MGKGRAFLPLSYSLKETEMGKQKKTALSKVNKKPKKILLLSHVITRDTLIDDIIINELKSRGYLVWKCGVTGGIKKTITTVKPDIVIMPELRCEFTVEVAKFLHEWGAQVVIRRCEMGHSEESTFHPQFEDALFGNYPEIYDYIQYDMVWGPKFKRMLSERFKQPLKKFKVIGAPFDDYFLKRPSDEEIKKRTPGKKSILFLTGFGYADINPIYAIPEALDGQEIHGRMVKFHREVRSKFIQMMRLVMAAVGDEADYLLRLHPGDREGIYRDTFGDDLGYVSAEFPIQSLMRADVVIHSGSTMGYEAHMENVPALNFGNFLLDKVVGQIHPIINCPYELCKALGKIEFGKSNAIKENVEFLEKNYYGPLDGKMHKRIADVIDLLSENETNIPNDWPSSKEPKFKSTGVMPIIEAWVCSECGSQFGLLPGRGMAKCPYCGIAVIKMVTGPIPKDFQHNQQIS